jgi:hypothetical protein
MLVDWEVGNNLKEVIRSDYEDGDELKQCTVLVLDGGEELELKGRVEGQLATHLGMKRRVCDKMPDDVYSDMVSVSIKMRKKPLVIRTRDGECFAVVTKAFSTVSDDDLDSLVMNRLKEAVTDYDLGEGPVLLLGQHQLSTYFTDTFSVKDVHVHSGISVMNTQSGWGSVAISPAWKIDGVGAIFLGSDISRLKHAGNARERLKDFVASSISTSLDSSNIEDDVKKAISKKFKGPYDFPFPKYVTDFMTKYMGEISGRKKPTIWNFVETTAFIFTFGAQHGKEGQLKDLSAAHRLKIGRLGHQQL